MADHPPAAASSPTFDTLAIHAGQTPDPSTGAVNVPIYASSTYVQPELGRDLGYEYSRVSNPTRTALETSLAALEGGRSAHVFASGMAAIQAVVGRLSAGDHVVCGSNVYGGTPRLFNPVMTRFGLRFSYADTRQPEAVERALEPATKLVFVVTPTNPLMELCDLRACADIAHRHGAELAVDNTFMSPYLQRPLGL
jgi:cystathionine beta-lyase/cystathionine gamma-synthase